MFIILSVNLVCVIWVMLMYFDENIMVFGGVVIGSINV